MKSWHLLLLGGLLTIFLLCFFLTFAIRLWFWLLTAFFSLTADLLIAGGTILLALWTWRRIRARLRPSI